MKVELIEAGKLSSLVIGGRICYNSYHRGGDYNSPTDDITDVDKKYLDKLINRSGHRSISRHLQYVMRVSGISTKTLLACTRHSIGINFSVMSSRFCKLNKFGASTTKTPNKAVNDLIDKHIEAIIELNNTAKVSAEDLAMLYPQAMHYDLVVSINPEAMQHFIDMRGEGTHAHYDIQEMAMLMLDAIPDTHRFLYKTLEDKLDEI